MNENVTLKQIKAVCEALGYDYRQVSRILVEVSQVTVDHVLLDHNGRFATPFTMTTTVHKVKS